MSSMTFIVNSHFAVWTVQFSPPYEIFIFGAKFLRNDYFTLLNENVSENISIVFLLWRRISSWKHISSWRRISSLEANFFLEAESLSIFVNAQFLSKREILEVSIYISTYEMFQTYEKKCFKPMKSHGKHPFIASQFPPFPTNNFEEQSPIRTEAIVKLSICSFYFWWKNSRNIRIVVYTQNVAAQVVMFHQKISPNNRDLSKTWRYRIIKFWKKTDPTSRWECARSVETSPDIMDLKYVSILWLCISVEIVTNRCINLLLMYHFVQILYKKWNLISMNTSIQKKSNELI